MIITGDAIARPMIETLEANPGRWNTDSLVSLSPRRALFSPVGEGPVPGALPEPHHHRLDRLDGGRVQRHHLCRQGHQGRGRRTDRRAGRDVVVLDDDLELIADGRRRIGKLGRGGNIPLGYYNDPKKTAETFVTAADGRATPWPATWPAGARRQHR